MKKKIKSIRPLARELGNVGCCGQTPSLHGVEAGCVAIDRKRGEIISRAYAFLKEKGLTQRRSPTGTRKVIGFENPEENNEWEMPVGVGRQYDRRPDRKAEYGQLRCVT